MCIYIPTKGRVGNQRTFELLPQRWRDRTTFVCPSDEIDHMPGTAIAFDGEGIAVTRQFIMDIAPTNKVFMFDDDLKFQERPDDWSLENTFSPFVRGEPVGVALDWMNEKLDEYAAVGFDSIHMNNFTKQRYEREAWRMMRAFGVQKSVFVEEGIRFDKYKYWEDFHVTLCLLRAGYINLISTQYCFFSLMNNPGGISLYRNIPELLEVRKAFLEEHGDFAHPVEKEAGSWGGFKKGDKIPDIRCQWKKALKSYAYLHSNNR